MILKNAVASLEVGEVHDALGVRLELKHGLLTIAK